MDNFPLFSLMPLDSHARYCVSHYNAENEAPLQKSVITFMSQRMSSVMGQFATFGHATTNDCRLPPFYCSP